jgi:DNA mismatch repair ATPase MutS
MMCNGWKVEHPLGSSCLQPLVRHTGLLHDSEASGAGSHLLSFGSLRAYMRLDSAAAAAINLFPRTDDPSQYGSLFGVLNRCKTKMGTRLLDRCVCRCDFRVRVCVELECDHRNIGLLICCLLLIELMCEFPC